MGWGGKATTPPSDGWGGPWHRPPVKPRVRPEHRVKGVWKAERHIREKRWAKHHKRARKVRRTLSAAPRAVGWRAVRLGMASPVVSVHSRLCGRSGGMRELHARSLCAFFSPSAWWHVVQGRGIARA
jgi:hypothetical protein